jgi:predicted negative regulator of RcsB-dependent stress response
MTEATQTPTLEQTLNKTDLGHMIYENRKLFFAALVAILVGALGFALWKQSKKNAALENSVKVFEFQKGPWSDTQSGKSDVATLLKAYEGLNDSVLNSSAMIPLTLEMVKFLVEKGNLSEAETILSKVNPKHPIQLYFVALQKAVVFEKSGKLDQAILSLEPLAQNKDGLMPAKVSLELGRLYLAKGEKGKAQTQFDYILSTFPNDDQAKLAKLYLTQLAQ